jgi:hypothetical protein
MKIRYIDPRPYYIPRLKYHKGGVALPYGDNIIEVTEIEGRGLMKMKNGKNPCWEVVENKKASKEKEDEVKENGNR